MKAIIHAGMQKTGSSSIQATFSRKGFPGIRYLPWIYSNHGSLLALLFNEPIEQFHIFRHEGKTRQDLLELRSEWKARLIDELGRDDIDRVIFSAELISTLLCIEEVVSLRDLFAQHCTEIDVIAYVRPPVGYMQSAFQQSVATGLDALRMPTLWPHYKKRFEKLDRIFGRENVTLRKFAPHSLVGGDAVIDFAAQVGVDLRPESIVRANESLSIEALSLLFFQRKFAGGMHSGFAGALRANNRFLNALRGIGTGKVRFSREAVMPVIEKNRDDLTWMEERLGEPLLDIPDEAQRTIGSEDDLVAIAEENAGALAALLPPQKRAHGLSGREQLVHDLQALQDIHVQRGSA